MVAEPNRRHRDREHQAETSQTRSMSRIQREAVRFGASGDVSIASFTSLETIESLL